MPSFPLLLLVLAADPAPPAATPTPPAPAAVHARGPESEAPAAEEPEEPEGDPVEGGSDELEQMRALEGATLDPGARDDAELLQSLNRLGVANPLRLRMLDALEEPTFREDEAGGELALVTDPSAFDVSRVKAEYDIPVEMQPLVAEYIQFFQGPGRKWYLKWLGRSTRYLPVMQPILEAQGLPRDTVYLAMIESGFAPSAYSWAHAAGPWQFIASTGKQYGLHQDFWVDERKDPLKATRAAGRYLKDLYSELGHWYLAWAGYNTGSSRVHKLMDRQGTNDFWAISAVTEKGLALETRHYVPKLIAAALIAKHPAAFGFSAAELEYEPPLSFEEVKVTDATDLDVIARAAGVSVEEVQDLNPELRRWCTPPASAKNPYVLRLPPSTGQRFAENFAKIGPKERLTFRVHTVKRGDTLSQIAQRYGSAVEAILQMNRMKSLKTLKLNTELVIPVPTGHGAKDEGAEGALARKVAQARRNGVTAVRPEDEVPAGTPRGPVAVGPVKTETINGRKRVTYGVQSGDSLWVIAQRFQVTAEEIRKWNDLSSRTARKALKVGSLLYVWPPDSALAAKPAVVEKTGTMLAQRAPPPPAPAAPPPPATAGSTGRSGVVHSLAAGESVWSIAHHYGVTVEDIKRWNNIKDTNHLPTGLKLTVSAP